jgi:hypothetical protein
VGGVVVVERTMTISDDEIVGMIRKGLLYLSEKGEIRKFHSKRKRFATLSSNWTDSAGRARVNLHIGNRQRTIQRNRLIWMISNVRCVPDGCDVHHINGDSKDDSCDNLEPILSGENRRMNTDKGYAEVRHFFALIEARRWSEGLSLVLEERDGTTT